MSKKLLCSLFVFTVGLGVALADEFTATITKVDGDKITYQKFIKKQKDGDPVTITVATNAKIAKGLKKKKLFEAGDTIEGGIKADVFSKLPKKGLSVRITTDADNKNVTQVLVLAGKKPNKKKKKDAAVAKEDGFQPLFNGKNLSGWKVFLGEDPKRDTGDPKTVITVKDGEIQVAGNPWGYFYTEKSYKNYVIQYSWTYPKDQPEKTTMNSGLLLHIQEPHKVWPKCVEPQGRYKDHGKIYFPGWAKDDPAKKESNFDEAAQKKALKESYEWNTTEATVRGDGSITVKINGIQVATGKTELTSGPIGFQSEGARIHFKDIKIKMLD